MSSVYKVSPSPQSPDQPQDPIALFHDAARKLPDAFSSGLSPRLQGKGTDADRAKQTNDLRRSNAIGRGNSVDKAHHLDIAVQSVSRAPASGSSSSSASITSSSSTLGSRASDTDLPRVLRCLVDKGYSCTTIGRYLVEILLGTDSFYSGLIARLVEANRTYCEICIQVFRRLDLSNEDGRPLECEVETGNVDLKPDPSRPTRSLYADGSEPAETSPSHGCTRDDLRRFEDVSDDQVEYVDVEMGVARMVDISRHPVHLVDSSRQ
ncbi:uncharacterized protein APUU_40548S [Aspergillus puulaauensis]|uniref:Uncharacterized protein n=1 Tax=Aspergillus puulaauensis TaxID=1220207 RepID=A0A7R7XNY2_9EURO|nr:uncharacterized protein APUU_40548S [Aspergillus puulaauensis]BCS24104.1 hypothetical protein APUU_40548S [Aspergillus puulaauensis]